MSQPQRMTPGVGAEYDVARFVLLHEPGPEVLSALLWPTKSSFEQSFDSETARSEHRAFCKQLQAHGIEVVLLRDLLAAHADLPKHARKALRFGLKKPSSSELAEVLGRLGSDDLVRVLLERPVVDVKQKGAFDDVELRTRALSNLYFMRDQLITTDRGVVLGRFALGVRRPEREVVRFALETLGITPLYAIHGRGILEGGDFIPAGEWALIGIGARSNQEAVNQLLNLPGAEAMGYSRIAVVKDPEKDKDWQQQEMHLDTYFMVLGADTCLVEGTRMRPPPYREPSPDKRLRPLADDRRPRVDIYRKTSDESYVPERKDVLFPEFVEKHLVMHPIRVPLEDQYAYGCNVLCLRNLTVSGSVSDEQDAEQRISYLRALRNSGVVFIPTDFTNIRHGYGANHCMTQVLVREAGP